MILISHCYDFCIFLCAERVSFCFPTLLSEILFSGHFTFADFGAFAAIFA
jgi:hypothetical protein